MSALQVVLSLGPGGTERLVIEIAKRTAPVLGAAVCCLDEPGAWAAELSDRGIVVEALHRTPGFHPGLGLRIAEVAARHGARVLHCHHYSPYVYGQIAALRRPGLRVVFTEHGRLSDAPPSAKRRIANLVLGRLPARIYAVSRHLRRHMVAEGFPPHRVGVVYNGIDVGPPPAPEDRAEARRLLSVPGDRFLVGTVGRLDPVKDLAMLIAAVAALRRDVPAAELVVVGDGPERERLAEAARAAGVAGAVRFTGHRGDVRRLLPALDIYANSSTHEGVSLTILEAMAAGLPVVATAVGGNPEVVRDGETGVLVPARAPDALARAARDLAAAPAARRALGEAGRRRVETAFTIDRMVADYVRAYGLAGDRARGEAA